MNSKFSLFFFIQLLLLSNLTFAETKLAEPITKAPITFDNEYKAKLYGFNITVNSRLSNIADNDYELVFNVDALIGSIKEKSHFQWNPLTATIKPIDYTYRRTGLGKSKSAELLFDWKNKSVTNKVDNSSWTMDIEKNVQDKLSYQAQLQLDLMKGLNNFSYQIADGGRLKEYKFTIESEEILDTPLGKVNTVKVKRSRDNDERITYAWLAKEWSYLLVRLQQEEKGKVHTTYIQKASVNGKAIKHF
jgi:Protein of unknown function (DUF3108)